MALGRGILVNRQKKSKRKTPSLSYCEYVSTDPDNSTQVWRARLWLIETAKQFYPLFLEKLSSDVFPFYCKLAEKGYDFDSILWSSMVSPCEALADSPEALNEEGDLKSALSKWAAEFNAETAWLMDDAFRTLRDWYVAPDWRKSLRWHAMHLHSGAPSIGEAFEFRYQGWETELLTWSRFSECLRGEFEKVLSEYETKTRKLAELCGLVRATRTHSPVNFRWFVLYQFEGLSSTAIADKWSKDEDPEHASGVDNSAILKGIKTAAKLVGWDRRTPRKPASMKIPRSNRDRKVR
jgi:hypothetical protein